MSTGLGRCEHQCQNQLLKQYIVRSPLNSQVILTKVLKKIRLVNKKCAVLETIEAHYLFHALINFLNVLTHE